MRASVLGRAPRRRLSALGDRPPANEVDQAARSHATEKNIGSFFQGWNAGTEDAQGDALNKIVRSWRADNAAGGVPVHGHLPLPNEFAQTLADIMGEAGARGRELFDGIVGKADPDARTLVAQQIAALIEQTPPERRELDMERPWADPSDPVRQGIESDARRAALSGDAVGGMGPTVPGTRQPGLQSVERGAAVPLSQQTLDPDSPEARKRADKLIEESWFAAATHPIAYGFDAAMEDLFGEDGPAGDFGWRRTIPAPRGGLSGAAGEAMRLYLTMFPPVRVAGGIAGATARAKSVIVRMGREALLGGGLSVAAEWAASRHKPLKDRPTGDQYAVVFLGGAISGANIKRDKAFFEAFVAIGTSIGTDFVAGRPASVPVALGAGLAAYVVARVGSKTDALRLFSQGSGRIARKFGEKVIKEFVTEIFGRGFEFTQEELKELWHGFDEMIRSRFK
jgi:hypothetical protein